jgi:ABC-type enterochelin transport system ATPase subunit
VDKIYEESIGSLKNTLDTALQYIFHDRNYSSELTLEDKRGTKTLDISLRDLDNDPDMLLDIKDDQGQGVAAVVSAILKTYLLINKNTRILLLDEKYSNVSQEYINRFFDFLRKMCEEKSFILVMVTHDDRMTPYADKVFQVNNGNVLLIKDKDD